MKRFVFVPTLLVGFLTFAAVGLGADDIEKKTSADSSAQPEGNTSGQHVLQYKFKQGEIVRTQVLHLATTKTRIRGNLQSSRSRGVSVKEWRFIEVNADGHMTFEHVVTEADMSNEVTGRAELKYNSKTQGDQPPPTIYEGVAASIGKTIAVVTITPAGEIIKQEQKYKQHSFGLGQMVFPLPDKPVALGDSWHFPTEILAALKNGQKKKIKTRQRYTLTKVAHGVATIEVATQVLTPINDPQVEVQLMQQVTKGTLKFDIDAGRLLSQRMDWDEQAVGFNGAQSTMEYLARFEEKLLEGGKLPESYKAASAPVAGPAGAALSDVTGQPGGDKPGVKAAVKPKATTTKR